jgi:hypothetical protein
LRALLRACPPTRRKDGIDAALLTPRERRVVQNDGAAFSCKRCRNLGAPVVAVGERVLGCPHGLHERENGKAADLSGLSELIPAHIYSAKTGDAVEPHEAVDAVVREVDGVDVAECLRGISDRCNEVVR